MAYRALLIPTVGARTARGQPPSRRELLRSGVCSELGFWQGAPYTSRKLGGAPTLLFGNPATGMAGWLLQRLRRLVRLSQVQPDEDLRFNHQRLPRAPRISNHGVSPGSAQNNFSVPDELFILKYGYKAGWLSIGEKFCYRREPSRFVAMSA